MNIGSRDDYIKYRFKRAFETFDEAIILSQNKKWNAVINRLYYSCFYAVIALLLKNNIETQTHDGVRTQFSLHFVKPGIIEKKYGKFFAKLFDLRQKGEYGDLFDYDEATVSPLIPQVEEFVKVLQKLIE